MDQIKTGKFIADERKKKGYTQRQLAEQLGISDKTIQNGSAEMVSRRFHCCCRYVTNWIYL